MVLSDTVRGNDPRARLVGRDAYLAAGGRIERELFDDDDSEAWADVALLENLAAAKMEEQAKALAAEQGLAWVKPTLDPYASHDLVDGLVRLLAEPAPLTEAELARLDELDVSYDEYAAILEDEDSAEEAVAAAEAAIEVIERQLGHLVRLVDDLLDVTRIASNKIKLQKRVVTVASIVKQAVEAAMPAIRP